MLVTWFLAAHGAELVLGQTVTLTGSVATVVEPHLIDSRNDRAPLYFAPDDGSPQLVVYSAEPAPCDLIRVAGAVIEVTGPGARRRRDRVVELQIDATLVECIAVPVAVPFPISACEAYLQRQREAPPDPTGCPVCPCACGAGGELVCAPCAACVPENWGNGPAGLEGPPPPPPPAPR